MKRTIPALLTLALTLVLSSCGWQLRGESMIPVGLESIHVTAQNPLSPLVRDLKRALASAGVATPDDASQTSHALVIIEESSDKRTATVSLNARISEQLLVETVDFMVLDNSGRKLIPQSTVSAERVFSYDENNVLATEDERRLIRSEMRRELVSLILNRLRQLRTVEDAPQT